MDYECVGHPAVSFLLAEAVSRLHPEEAALRASEESAMPRHQTLGGMPSFPLFVLEPLLPGQTLHLHVFEPRYILLTERALADPRLGAAVDSIQSPVAS